MSSNISIYARCRPHEGLSPVVADADKGIVRISCDAFDTTAQRQSQMSFVFSGVFGQNATQEDVFQGVTLPILKSFLEGVNGTILAYGQTVWF